MTLEVTAFTGLGPGPHDVVVTDVTVKVAKASGGEYLRWEFANKDGRTTSTNAPKEMTPGNKTGKWFAELTGRPTVVGEQRQLAEVIGRPCSIFIELNPEGYPKVVGLTARKADPSPVKPLREATENAAKQHAAQEGDDLPF